MTFKNKGELLEYTKSIIGKRLRDFSGNVYVDFKVNKGRLGQLIEIYLYNKKLDNNKKSDLELEDGTKVEIKSTGLKKNNNGELRAKERLVLSQINYNKDYQSDFYESDLMKKLDNVLLLFYLWEKNKNPIDYKFLDAMYIEFTESDLKIIEDDFKTIQNKIKNGLAHELSESDTFYLSACTKGKNNKSVTTQPFSDEPAKTRAFSFKPSFVNKIFKNEKFVLNDIHENIILDPREHVHNVFQRYIGMDLSEINEILSDKYSTKMKNKNAKIVEEILKRENSLEFIKNANISIKTIKLIKQKNGIIKPQEHMKIQNINIDDLSKEWEETKLYLILDEKLFLFVYFYENEIYDVKLFNFSLEIKKDFKRLFDEYKKGYYTGFDVESSIKSSDSKFSHIRPSGINSKDTILTQAGEEVMKSGYWLNRDQLSYIIMESELK